MIVFRNPGLIDLDAIRTFGANVKEGANPIGYFGTGLKYALSVLLREQCEVTIWRGMNAHKFEAKPKDIRGKTFQIVHMDDEPLAFTLELGKNWESWMAFRELASNAIDEGGSYAPADHTAFDPHSTVVAVTGAAIDKAWAQRDQIFLPTDRLEKIHDDGSVQIFRQESTHVFYRGVQLMKLEKPSVHTYNIMGTLQLTEDRTAASPWYVVYNLRDMIAQIKDEEAILRMITSKQHFESEGELNHPSDAFLAVVRAHKNDPYVNPNAKDALRKHGKPEDRSPATVPIMAAESRALDGALAKLEKLGYTNTYPIHVTIDMSDDCLGLALNGEIYLNRRVFAQGSNMLAGTLLEEYLHLAYGLPDESRRLQNFLLDLLMTTLNRVPEGE